MRDRLSAWDFGSHKTMFNRCPACGFRGVLLYVHTCDCCGLSLVDCPKCRTVQCLGSGNDNSLRQCEIDPRELCTGLLPVKEKSN